MVSLNPPYVAGSLIFFESGIRPTLVLMKVLCSIQFGLILLIRPVSEHPQK